MRIRPVSPTPAFDYIIIGAGSAGCVLANRLSEDPHVRVLLVEAGPRDWHPFIHMPAGLARLVNRTDINWNYHTEPEPQLGGRRLWWPRGKVLGGSSAINAMCYTRGSAADYDAWAASGARGWDWASVLPYFRRSEGNARGADALHGDDGPLSVCDLRHVNPLSHAFVDAACQAGFAHNPDFNGPVQEGVGLYQVTQRDGARCSAAGPTCARRAVAPIWSWPPARRCNASPSNAAAPAAWCTPRGATPSTSRPNAKSSCAVARSTRRNC